MKHLSLKQRRRHKELAAQLEAMRGNEYLFPPADYEPGKDPELDAKYRENINAFNAIAAEMHELEEIGRRGW